MKIAIDMTTFHLRRIGMGMLGVALATLFLSWTGAVAVAATGLLLITRADDYVVLRRRAEIERRLRKPLELLSFAHALEPQGVTITKPPIRIRILSFGPGALLLFSFPEAPTAREMYAVKTLVKYQRSIRASG